MGNIKKPRKKYKSPRHPWDRTRIQGENVLVKEYGLKNKTEFYKMNSFLKNVQKQVLNLTPKTTLQAKKELDSIVVRFKTLGFLKEDAAPGDILNLSVKEILDRRLQTFVMKKGLARTVAQ